MPRTAARRHDFQTGKPVTVAALHGTTGEISAFDPTKLGSLTQAASAKLAFWFSDSNRVAAYYGQAAAREANTRRVDSRQDHTPAAVSAELRFENPLVVDMGGRLKRAQPFAQILRNAKKAANAETGSLTYFLRQLSARFHVTAQPVCRRVAQQGVQAGIQR